MAPPSPCCLFQGEEAVLSDCDIAPEPGGTTGIVPAFLVVAVLVKVPNIDFSAWTGRISAEMGK
jgi:hypothetical protein